METEKVIIIGGGPCGLSCALELKKVGIDSLIVEKGNVVNSIYHYPTHQTFFSSSDRLEIGGIPFITENKKPVRNQALAYYREVAWRKKLRINSFEEVIDVKRNGEFFDLVSVTSLNKKNYYRAENVIIATGYYGQPNYLHIPGEDLDKVMHYFKEAHPYFNKDVVVIGGKNSAVDATLELHKAGARITVLYRGSEYSKSIKPWILPEFESLVRNNRIKMYFNAEVKEIDEKAVYFVKNGQEQKIKNDFVFAMTGYRPDVEFMKKIGININENNGKPQYQPETYETNIPGIYIAGVVASGFNNNEIFIENGRYHGEAIAKAITNA